MTGEEHKLEEQIMAAFEKVADIEDEIEKINADQVEEEARLQHRFDLKKAPLYAKRNAIIRDIPNFWMDALVNHQIFSSMITDDDMPVLEHLKNVEVTRSEDDFRSFKITFYFGENPFFANEGLVKELTASGDQSIKVTNSPIQWKEGKNVTAKSAGANGKRKADDEESFFSWFSEDSDDSIEIANLLISDFYPNAMSYYQGQDDDEDEEDDDMEYDLGSEDDDDEDEDEEVDDEEEDQAQ